MVAIPPLRRLRQTTREGQQLQESAGHSFELLAKSPIVDGVLLERLALTTTAQLIEHKLGRPYRGIVIVSHPEGAAGGIVTVAGNVLWAWNETDTSQFDTSLAGGGTADLSVVTTGVKPSLKLKITGNVPSGSRSYMSASIKTSEVTLPSRYLLRALILNAGDAGGTGNTRRAHGFEFASTGGTGANKYSHCTGRFIGQANLLGWRWEAGTVPADNTEIAFNGNNLAAFGWLEMEVMTKVNGAAGPNWMFHHFGSYGSNADGVVQRESDWGLGAAGAGWNGLALPSAGLALASRGVAAGGTTDAFVEFAQFEVLKHPMDWAVESSVEAEGLVEETSPDASKYLNLRVGVAGTYSLWVF